MLKRFILLLVCLLIISSSAFGERKLIKISVFPLPPNLSATVQFYEPSGNNILDADETGKLIITVQNNGKGDAFDIKAEINANKALNGLYYDKTVHIGTIPAEGSLTKEVELRASEEIQTDTLSYNIEVKEANGFDANPLKIAFKTKSFEPPKLVIADMGIEDQNKNYKVEPMEIVEITARVQNIGYGDARNVSVDIHPGQNVFMAGEGTTHFELENIQAGKFRDVKFMFYTNNRIKDGEKIPITIDIKERRPKFSASNPLSLVMNAPQKKTDEVIVKGIETEKKPDIQLATGLSIDVDMTVPESSLYGKTVERTGTTASGYGE
ncbi:MAG: hypothetical protein HY754_14350 [Nitrospirae bacterium]|nr:hypothetical protein [Nitrospirota bacterium]